MNVSMRLMVAAGLFWLGIAPAQGRPVADPENPHNLSFDATHGRTRATDSSQPGAREICIFCHTPHGASAQGALWNRYDPNTFGAFPLYNSATLQIKNIPAAQYDTTANYPNGASKLCLSCHDGVTGIGTLLDRAITMNHETMADAPTSTTFDPVINLELTHPVSFVFNEEVLAAIKVNKPDMTLPSLEGVDLLDSQDRVQCTTCHDPHDDRAEVVYNSAGIPPFWRYVTTTEDPYTAVCNECHPDTGVTYDKHHTVDFP